MRFLNIDTMKLEEFVDDSTIPAYSILSHRWADEEVCIGISCQMTQETGAATAGRRYLDTVGSPFPAASVTRGSILVAYSNVTYTDNAL
jgi:hypothetical protein